MGGRKQGSQPGETETRAVRLRIQSTISGDDGKPLRAGDAIGLLFEAYYERNLGKRHALCEQAIMAAVFGTINQYVFKARGDRSDQRGRPPGGKRDKRVKELQTRVDNGEKPTPAAMEVLRSHGVKGKLKGRADALVRRWKRSAKNP